MTAPAKKDWVFEQFDDESAGVLFEPVTNHYLAKIIGGGVADDENQGTPAILWNKPPTPAAKQAWNDFVTAWDTAKKNGNFVGGGIRGGDAVAQLRADFTQFVTDYGDNCKGAYAPTVMPNDLIRRQKDDAADLNFRVKSGGVTLGSTGGSTSSAPKTAPKRTDLSDTTLQSSIGEKWQRSFKFYDKVYFGDEAAKLSPSTTTIPASHLVNMIVDKSGTHHTFTLKCYNDDIEFEYTSGTVTKSQSLNVAPRDLLGIDLHIDIQHMSSVGFRNAAFIAFGVETGGEIHLNRLGMLDADNIVTLCNPTRNQVEYFLLSWLRAFTSYASNVYNPMALTKDIIDEAAKSTDANAQYTVMQLGVTGQLSIDVGVLPCIAYSLGADTTEQTPLLLIISARNHTNQGKLSCLASYLVGVLPGDITTDRNPKPTPFSINIANAYDIHAHSFGVALSAGDYSQIYLLTHEAQPDQASELTQFTSDDMSRRSLNGNSFDGYSDSVANIVDRKDAINAAFKIYKI